jgi:hypothetical protein
MDEQTARAIARDLIRIMLEPMFLAAPNTKYKPLTLVQLLHAGAYFTRRMVDFASFRSDALDEELYTILATLPVDRDRLEDFLFRWIMAEKGTPEEIAEARRQMAELTPSRLRGLYTSMLKEVLPAGSPGRRRKLEESELPKLATLSDDLMRPVQNFLVLRKHFPNRSIAECIEFLAAESSPQAKYLIENVIALEQLLQDAKLLHTARTEKSRCRLIADAMAGLAFSLKPSYAIRKAKEARRRRRSGPAPEQAQN